MRILITSNPITPYGEFVRGDILNSDTFPTAFLTHLVEEANAAEWLDRETKIDDEYEAKKKAPIYTIIATGQSLTKEDCEKAHEKSQTIVVNDAWKLLPNADYHYACDKKWWEINYNDVKSGYKGQSFTINDEDKSRNPDKKYDLRRIDSRFGKGLSDRYLHYGLNGGGNSGYQAINLAYMLGAKTIILLGFDMFGTHFFGKHPPKLDVSSPFKEFIKSFETITEVEVINCSRQTSLNCFPKKRLKDVLQ